MPNHYGFAGTFAVDLWEGDRLVFSHTQSPNRILRVGLVSIVRDGHQPGLFGTFAVGSNDAPESSAHLGVLTPLDQKAGERMDDLAFPDWGYVATFEPGEGTGLWREIGMRYSSTGPFLNRALFTNGAGIPIAINKTALTRATVRVRFRVFRV